VKDDPVNLDTQRKTTAIKRRIQSAVTNIDIRAVGEQQVMLKSGPGTTLDPFSVKSQFEILIPLNVVVKGKTDDGK
jgi:hypothetical protein